jgi:hypothetical protein
LGNWKVHCAAVEFQCGLDLAQTPEVSLRRHNRFSNVEVDAIVPRLAHLAKTVSSYTNGSNLVRLGIGLCYGQLTDTISSQQGCHNGLHKLLAQRLSPLDLNGCLHVRVPSQAQ